MLKIGLITLLLITVHCINSDIKAQVGHNPPLSSEAFSMSAIAKADEDTVDVEEEVEDDDLLEIDADQVELSQTTSFVVSSGPVSFKYDEGTWVDNTGYMAQIGTPKSNLRLIYADSQLFEATETFTIRGDLQVGGNANLWDSFLMLPLQIYVPVRFNLGYQHLHYDLGSEDYRDDDHNIIDYRVRDNKNFLNLNLGAGLGATFTLPFDDIPLLGERLTADLHLTRSPGTMIRFISDDSGPREPSEDNEVGVAIANEFLFQVKIDRFLEANVGATVGIRSNSLNWSRGGNFNTLIEGISGEQLPDHVMEYTMFYFGINW